MNVHNLLTLHTHIEAWRVLAQAEDRCRTATLATHAAAAAADYVRQRIALMSTNRYKIANFTLCTLDIEFQILRAKLNPPDSGPFCTEVMQKRIADLPRVPDSWVLEHPESMVSFLIRFVFDANFPNFVVCVAVSS